MDKKEKAKAVTIESLYPDKNLIKGSGERLQAPCLFHRDEKQPNLFIYKKTNTYFCFKCGVGGDSISFYMKLHNTDFKTAINKLS